jgi:hypothetical protein
MEEHFMPIRKGWNDASAVAIRLSWFLILAVVPAARAQKAPVYEVDPSWPKPLPNHWLMQGVPVMVTDKDDHIWVYNRPRDINPDESGAATTPPRTDCCVAAPAVLEFDTAGNLIKGWGGPGYVPRGPAPNTLSLWTGKETSGWAEAPEGTASKNLRAMGSCCGTSAIGDQEHRQDSKRRL